MSDESSKPDPVSAALNVFDKLQEARKENSDIYRAHIRGLVESDFIQVVFTMGAMNFNFTGKSSTLSNVLLSIERLCDKVLAADETYENAPEGNKDVAYG